jgi:hypothetical protein
MNLTHLYISDVLRFNTMSINLIFCVEGKVTI